MKRFITLLMALMMGVALHAQSSVPNWTPVGTLTTVTDINGNTVNIADTLAAGKCVVVDFSATWCSWCWVMHSNGILDSIRAQLGSSVSVMWVESDASTTTSEIYGNGSSTQGDWTNNGTVPYPIIDNATYCSILGSGYEVSAFPTVVFISPSGYWCEVYGTDWGFGPYSASDAVSAVSALTTDYPSANSAPIVGITGQNVCMANADITLSATIVSVDSVTSVTWGVDGGTITANYGSSIDVQWSTAGQKTVTLTVSNLGSDGMSRSATDTFYVTVQDGWTWGDEMSYCGDGTFATSIGAGGSITWGIYIPAAYMTDRDYLSNVKAYVVADGTYSLIVAQGPASGPVTEVWQYSYTVDTSECWYTFPIYNTVALNDQMGLWVVLSSSASYYPAAATDFAGDYNGSMVYLSGTWVTLQDASDGSLDYTWMIKVTTSSNVPALVTGITGPQSFNSGTAVTFTASGDTATSYNWTLQGATPATATGQTVTAIWNTGGTYTVSVTATKNGQTATASKVVTVNDCPVNQLPFTMGFESGDDIGCLSTVDADADGNSWVYWSYKVHSGSYSMASASYDNNGVALYPDNWLVLPAVHIPAEGATINWWDVAQDTNYGLDFYAVMISSTGSEPADFSTTLWSGTTTNSWRNLQATIPASYAGQDVNIAFRHYNCSDWFYVVIDDISITAGGDTTGTLPGDTTLAWNWGDTISYCGSEEMVSSIGLNGNGEITWGIRVPAQYMTGRNYLSEVLTYITTPGSYELLIYNPVSDSLPGTPIYQQSYNVTTSEDWHSLHIYGTLSLNTSNDLWVVLHTDGLSYPASYVDFVGDYNSSLIYYDDGWYYLQQLSDQLDPTWMINAVTSSTMPTPVLEMEIDGPAQLSVGTPATFTATTISGATYNWTLQNATPSTSTANPVTATWSAAGTYNVSVTATLGSQTATASMTVTVVDCPVNQLPFIMGFESGDQLSCISTIDADADGHGWMLASTANFGISDSIAHSGSDAMMSASYINNIGALTPDNWLILPQVAIPDSGATITWWDYALDQSYSDDYYEVMVSANGSSTTSFTTTIWGGTTTANGWTQRTATIPTSFANQNVYVAFRHYNCTDWYWAVIDDISITAGTSSNPDTTVVTDCPVFYLPFTLGFEVEDTTAIECIVTHDADGDYNEWQIWGPGVAEGLLAHTGQFSVASASYDNNSGALTPDNWLVLPQIHIPAEGATLTWWDNSQDHNYSDDNYAVMISASGNATFDFTTTLWEDVSDTVWRQNTVDIPSTFANQDVYIAFRHYDCTDQFYVVIDDISITPGGQEPLETATVTVNCGGNGGGLVIDETGASICGTTNEFYVGTTLTYAFLPYDGSVLSHVLVNNVDVFDQIDSIVYEGEFIGYYYTFTLTESTVLEAIFVNPESDFTITVTSSDPLMGAVSGGGVFGYGDTTIVSATPYSGYVFTGWQDGMTDNPRTVVVTSDMEYIAYFVSETGVLDADGSGIVVSHVDGHILVNGAEGKRVMVFDALGRLLYNTSNATNELSVKTPAAGVYIVKSGDTAVKKVVVN